MPKKHNPVTSSKIDTSLTEAHDGVLDITQLADMHPRLPGDMVATMLTRAALGLQRNHHLPGVALHLTVEEVKTRLRLEWPSADSESIGQHDFNRITEDGAEAIVLAVAHRSKGWQVLRRMQREESADWLLEHISQGTRRLVAVEVSGVDSGNVATRLREKLEQVAKNKDKDIAQRWAGVVGFKKPQGVLEMARTSHRGR